MFHTFKETLKMNLNGESERSKLFMWLITSFHLFPFLKGTIREGKTALSGKTQSNTELIERKTSLAQELIILAKSKERSEEILKKVRIYIARHYNESKVN